MSKITLDNLSDNLKEYLEGLGLSEEQVLNLINENGLDEEELKAMLKETMSINELSTNSKTVIGAINELFQSANNGKELIASAIGEPLDASDTFSAMSDDINSLLSTFKTNMMNNGVTVESSDKFKSLIDKIATLADNEGKGIQYASGICTQSSYSSGEYDSGTTYTFNIQTNLTFVPDIIFVRMGYNNVGSTSDISNKSNLYISNLMEFNEDYTAYIDINKISIDNITKEGFQINVTTSRDSMGLFNDWYAIGVGEEDTTLRDSLANILENKGVDVTEEDDMASLISKLDSIPTSNIPSWYQASDIWIRANSFTTDLYPNGLATYGSKIYVMGNNSDRKVYYYDVNNNIWTYANTEIPEPQRTGVVACTVDDNIYCGGGYSTENCTNFNMYNITNNTWSEKTSMPGLVYCAPLVHHDGKIHVLGAIYTGVYYFMGWYIYDIGNNTWTTDVFNGNATYTRAASAIVGNTIYMIGGWQLTYDSDDNTIYRDMQTVQCADIEAKTWTYKSTLTSTGPYQGEAVVIDDQIYFVATGRNSRYDPTTDTWTDLLTTDDDIHHIVEHGGRIHAIGKNTHNIYIP